MKDPKTSAGRRVVALDAEAIKALRSRLKKAKRKDLNPRTFLSCSPMRGGYLRGSNFDRRLWYPIREAAGIPNRFVVHDLRHTQASLMLAAGVDLKVIQKRLGHRDFVSTANTFSFAAERSERGI